MTKFITRFVEKDDCYLDIKTGLEWQKNNNKAMICYKAMTWHEAIEFCDLLKGGWRLPTMGELMSIVNFNKCEPATNLPGIRSTCYWSSTVCTYDTDAAWSICLNNGCTYVFHKDLYKYIYCVRWWVTAPMLKTGAFTDKRQGSTVLLW